MDPVTGTDIANKRDNGFDLWLRKRLIAVLVPRIDNLDADRSGIDVGLAFPEAPPRMPGPAGFRHALQDAAILVDDIVGRDFRTRITQALQGFFAGRHAGVMEHDHIHRGSLRPLSVVGRRMDPGLHTGISRNAHMPLSAQIFAQASFSAARRSFAILTNSSGTPLAISRSGCVSWTSRR